MKPAFIREKKQIQLQINNPSGDSQNSKTIQLIHQLTNTLLNYRYILSPAFTATFNLQSTGTMGQA